VHFELANFPVAYCGLKIITSLSLRFPDFQRLVVECIPDTLLRQDAILQHPVFHKYHSETEMMRYMRKLARKDIALDRSMIPLTPAHHTDE
jgi:glycine dehydrogenase